MLLFLCGIDVLFSEVQTALIIYTFLKKYCENSGITYLTFLVYKKKIPLIDG